MYLYWNVGLPLVDDWPAMAATELILSMHIGMLDTALQQLTHNFLPHLFPYKDISCNVSKMLEPYKQCKRFCYSLAVTGYLHVHMCVG